MTENLERQRASGATCLYLFLLLTCVAAVTDQEHFRRYLQDESVGSQAHALRLFPEVEIEATGNLTHSLWVYLAPAPYFNSLARDLVGSLRWNVQVAPQLELPPALASSAAMAAHREALLSGLAWAMSNASATAGAQVDSMLSTSAGAGPPGTPPSVTVELRTGSLTDTVSVADTMYNSTSALLLLYRQDLLRAANWSVPATWDDLAALAEQDFADLNADGELEPGLCMDACNGTALLHAVLSSTLQIHGTTSGSLLDVDTLQPLWLSRTGASDAAGYALGLAARIMRAAANAASMLASSSNSSIPVGGQAQCTTVNTFFASGRCVVTLAWDWEVALLASASGACHQPSTGTQARNGSLTSVSPALRGQLGVALVPGSTLIAARADGAYSDAASSSPENATTPSQGNWMLQFCSSPKVNRSLACKHATLEAVSPASFTLHDSSVRGSTDGQGSLQWVNRAPFSAFTPRLRYQLIVEGDQWGGDSISGGWVPSAEVLGVATAIGEAWRRSLRGYAAARASALSVWIQQVVIGGASTASQLPRAWNELGMDPGDSNRLLAALAQVVTHPNAALDPFPGLGPAGDYMAAASQAAMQSALQVLQSTSVKDQDEQMLDLVMRLASSWRAAIMHFVTNDTSLASATIDALQNILGGEGPSPAPSPPPPASRDASDKLSRSAIIAVIVTTTCSAALLVVAVIVFAFRRRSHAGEEYHTLSGAPGVSSDTCLLVTDVQASTHLYEVLPSEIMDRAMVLHDACIRRCLKAHKGYESANEGDSFVCAFHGVIDAVSFAMTVQMELMMLDWPPELLLQDICAPVAVALHSMNSIASQMWPPLPGSNPGGHTGAGGNSNMNTTALLQHATSINGDVIGSSMPGLLRRDSTALMLPASQHGPREDRDTSGCAGLSSTGFSSIGAIMIHKRMGAQTGGSADMTASNGSVIHPMIGAAISPLMSGVSTSSSVHGQMLYGWLDKKSGNTRRSDNSSHRVSSVDHRCSSVEASAHGPSSYSQAGAAAVLAWSSGRTPAGAQRGIAAPFPLSHHPGAAVNMTGGTGDIPDAAPRPHSPDRLAAPPSRAVGGSGLIKKLRASPSGLSLPGFAMKSMTVSGSSAGLMPNASTAPPSPSLYTETSLAQIRVNVAGGSSTTSHARTSRAGPRESGTASGGLSPVLLVGPSVDGRQTPVLTQPPLGRDPVDSDEDLADSLYAPSPRPIRSAGPSPDGSSSQRGSSNHRQSFTAAVDLPASAAAYAATTSVAATSSAAATASGTSDMAGRPGGNGASSYQLPAAPGPSQQGGSSNHSKHSRTLKHKILEVSVRGGAEYYKDTSGRGVQVAQMRINPDLMGSGSPSASNAGGRPVLHRLDSDKLREILDSGPVLETQLPTHPGAAGARSSRGTAVGGAMASTLPPGPLAEGLEVTEGEDGLSGEAALAARMASRTPAAAAAPAAAGTSHAGASPGGVLSAHAPEVEAVLVEQGSGAPATPQPSGGRHSPQDLMVTFDRPSLAAAYRSEGGHARESIQLGTAQQHQFSHIDEEQPQQSAITTSDVAKEASGSAPVSIPGAGRQAPQNSRGTDDRLSGGRHFSLTGTSSRSGPHGSLPIQSGGILSTNSGLHATPFSSSVGRGASPRSASVVTAAAAGMHKYAPERIPSQNSLRMASNTQLSRISIPSNGSTPGNPSRVLQQAQLPLDSQAPGTSMSSPPSTLLDVRHAAFPQRSHVSFTAAVQPHSHTIITTHPSLTNMQSALNSHAGAGAGSGHAAAGSDRSVRTRLSALMNGTLGSTTPATASVKGGSLEDLPAGSMVPRSGASFLMPGSLLVRARTVNGEAGGGSLEGPGTAVSTAGAGEGAGDADDAAWGSGPAPTWGEMLRMLWPLLTESETLEFVAQGGPVLQPQGSGDVFKRVMGLFSSGRSSLPGAPKGTRTSSTLFPRSSVQPLILGTSPVHLGLLQPAAVLGTGGVRRPSASYSKLAEQRLDTDWDEMEMQLSIADRSSKPTVFSQIAAGPPSTYGGIQAGMQAGTPGPDKWGSGGTPVEPATSTTLPPAMATSETLNPPEGHPPSSPVGFIRRTFSRQKTSTHDARTQQQLIYRGLRVRMGAHVGLQSTAEVHQSRAAGGRVHYTGVPLKIATAVSSAACGGAVLLSQAALKRLIADANLGPAAVTDLSNHKSIHWDVFGPGGGTSHGPKHGRGAAAGARHVLPAGAIVSYMGDHELEGLAGGAAFMGAVSGGAGSCGGWPLYSVVPERAFARMAHLSPPSTKGLLRRGVLDAPVVAPTFVFIYIVGAQQLLADVPLVARGALDTLQALCSAETWPVSGYVVEASDTYILAAFPRACDALAWGLSCRAVLLSFPGWDRDLLSHSMAAQRLAQPLQSPSPAQPTSAAVSAPPAPNPGRGSCRPSAQGRPSGNGVTSPTTPADPSLLPPIPGAVQVLERGPRIKVGVDCGCVTAELHPCSGRLNYRGKVLNRAARVANLATPGQVLCTSRAWARAQSDISTTAALQQPTSAAAGRAPGPHVKIDSKGVLLAVPEAGMVLDGSSRASRATDGSTGYLHSTSGGVQTAGTAPSSNRAAVPPASPSAATGAAAGGSTLGTAAPSRPQPAAEAERGAHLPPRLAATALGSVALKGIPDLVELVEVRDLDDSPVWAVPKKQPQQQQR